MQQQRGFTLIELIIVIVILGILAVTAAPRFIDLSSDATASTLKGVKAAMQSGAQLVYAKSAIAGQQTVGNAGDATSQVSVSGVDVQTDFGYPDAELMTEAMLAGWVQLDIGVDFNLVIGDGDADTPAAGTFGIAPGATATDYTSDACHVIYEDAASANGAPTITVVDTGC
ncbi:prepilin-type N-terminal cleavage/methylation domain-containing protein [Aliiglaciecola lipolytica]|uniref:MSHA pilin protein MshA n=1 Tax=Aliiglaciecola lipolytica E3 TaxID=1127673 RepID=K6YAW5_9ALTE|nr:prepilin-type N-terminal cleavage/methylation domain-containing protein [Aliiglaciecola lipolytica]GAC13783.1 MSHA pilin protein MshA [Aliiglaciecola lipolytica E3]